MRCRFVGREGDPSFSGATVVVDVLRAFTTAAWALELGTREIVLLADLDEALARKDANPGSLAFCDGPPRPGFDLFNSPVQLQDLDVAGRTIFQRTAAGTQGATASRHCSPLLCTGFVTAGATATFLRRREVDEVCFVVTGGDEDAACADHVEALLRGDDPGTAFVERARLSETAAQLAAAAGVYPGVDARDVATCLELDRFDFAMEATEVDGALVLRRCP